MKTEKVNKGAILSTLWIFATLNYLYCDLMGFMDAGMLKQYLTGTVNGMEINREFLLGAAILIEIPISLVLLSRVLNHRACRWANIIAGLVMTVVQSATLIIGTPTSYYLFFSIIEIATTIFIFWYALNWKPVIKLPGGENLDPN